jgi:hypothetical protein
MADDRTYIKLHDGFDEHPKVAGLSDKAFRTYIEALCYCARNLTDGRISFAVARKLAPPRVWAVLTAVRLVDAHDDHYSLHDYLEHQRSAEQVRQLKEARREAGKRGGNAKASALASARGVASDLPKQTASKAVPDTEAEKEELLRSSSDDDEPDLFAEFYDAYPRKEAKRKAEQAYRSALKRANHDVIMAGLGRFQFSADKKFIPLPASWLNADRWADEASNVHQLRPDDPHAGMTKQVQTPSGRWREVYQDEVLYGAHVEWRPAL